MRNKHKQKNLVRSLAWSYLSFTLAFILAGTIIVIIVIKTASQYPNWKDIDKQLPELKRQDFQDFPIQDIAGPKAGFIILDKNGQSLYTSQEDGLQQLTKEELSLVPSTADDLNVSMELNTFTNQAGQRQYFLHREHHQGLISLLFDTFFISGPDAKMEEDNFVLDQNFQVLSSSRFREGTSLKNLTPILASQHSLVKYPFTNTIGRKN